MKPEFQLFPFLKPSLIRRYLLGEPFLPSPASLTILVTVFGVIAKSSSCVRDSIISNLCFGAYFLNSSVLMLVFIVVMFLWLIILFHVAAFTQASVVIHVGSAHGFATVVAMSHRLFVYISCHLEYGWTSIDDGDLWFLLLFHGSCGLVVSSPGKASHTSSSRKLIFFTSSIICLRSASFSEKK